MNYELFCTFAPKFKLLSTKDDTLNWRFPAEWEPQWGVQLTWPHAATDWAPMLDEICATYKEIAREIARREHLLIIVPEGESLSDLTSRLSARAEDACHQLCVRNFKSNDTWARDHGFITLTDDHNNRRLLDFRFNGWGEKFPAELDNALNRRLYDNGAIEGEYVDCLDFVLEGGSVESDCRAYPLDRPRKPYWRRYRRAHRHLGACLSQRHLNICRLRRHGRRAVRRTAADGSATENFPHHRRQALPSHETAHAPSYLRRRRPAPRYLCQFPRHQRRCALSHLRSARPRCRSLAHHRRGLPR